MPYNNDPIFPAAPKWNAVTIVNSDNTAAKTLWTPPTNGSKIVALGATGDDTSTRDIQILVTKGAVDYAIGTMQLPITGGTIVATAGINFFDGVKMPWLPLDADGQRYLLLESGCVLKGRALVAVTSTKTINLFAFGSDF